ncbi:MAG: peroxide stress protein YaaA [Alphaproteobacteria bacterium]|nr:peroxide stress protein YaaA [Alphaproteobacteria bacterium]
MIVVISPSKTLDFSGKSKGEYTIPDFVENSIELLKVLCKLTVSEIAELMDLSEKLAVLNYRRYHDFSIPFTLENSRQAIYAFKGDVYEGLDAEAFTQEDIKYAQSHLRIISGLYGLLRPLDLIQPYRLEMGIKLINQNYKNLYEYWGNKITVKLNDLLKSGGNNLLVNLASTEYFKVLNPKLFNARLVTPVFKERKNREYKVIPIFAKKARGLMASYIIKQRVENIDGIKQFREDGYGFNLNLSTETELVFTR